MNIGVFIAVLLLILILFGGVAYLLMNRQTVDKKRMMAVIQGEGGSDSGRDKDKSERDKRRAEIAKKLKEQDGEGDDKEGKVSISAKLEQAGLAISVGQFWLYSAICAVVVVGVAMVMGYSPFVILMMGITALLGLPRAFVRAKIKNRQKKFLEEFADALEAMVRLLKAGMPVSEAISMAGREFEGPVGEEMTRIYDAQRVGIPLAEAAYKAAERMPLTEMQMFATGIAIQAQTGASLSEVLMNLAGVIRARYRLKRKVQAMSSEAKASAGIIGSLPILVGGGLYLLNPEGMMPLFTTTGGQITLTACVLWMACGVLVMKSMINFKV